MALLFALLGSGAENLTWAFQIGFVSSLLFGLAAMEVAEAPQREGAPRLTGAWGRDMTAAALALAALMCSTVGLATTLALAVVVWSRHGWRRTVRVLALPLGAFSIWFGLAGRVGFKNTGDTFDAATVAKVPRFVASYLSQAVGHIAGRGPVGAGLAVVLAAWLLGRSPRLFRRHPGVLGGAAAAVFFYLLAALGRDRIGATISPSRYAYVGAALLLPALALLMTAVIAAGPRRPAPVEGPPSGPGRAPSLLSGPGPAPSRAPHRVFMAFSPQHLVGVARVALVSLVVAATVGNAFAGARFARSRTVYVRGLENEIVTTGALLQSPVQLARAIDPYPIWASGFAAGYLTPGLLAHLYGQGLLPRARPGLMTSAELLNDESWLDLTGKVRPIFGGRFRLLGAVGLTLSQLSSPGPAPPALPGWPSGPGHCMFARPSGRYLVRSFPTSLRFGLARRSRSGALWVSLGSNGGLVLIYLARPWGLDGFPGGVALEGEQVRLTSGGNIWLNDSAPGDELVVQLPARLPAEVCALSTGLARAAGPGGGAAVPSVAQPHQRAAATMT